jgi:aldehyde:ferredoxin oxidoreductase
MFGWNDYILRIDVSNKKVSKEKIDKSVLRKYIGGRGLGTYLIYKETDPTVDANGPENRIIFSVGPLTGTPIGSSRMSVTTKSPQTGFINDHSFGGMFPAEFKYAGYESMIIKGRAEEPVYIFIDNDDVSIRSAKHLWGMTTSDTHRALLKELGDPAIKVLCIGPAGEHECINAVMINDLYHTSGRGATGCVMGQKKIKAIAVRGNKKVKISDPERYMKAYSKFFKELSPEDCIDLFHRPWGMVGSIFATDYIRAIGGLLSKNDQLWDKEYCDKMIGTSQTRDFIVRPHACYGCALPSCSQLLKFRDGKIGKMHSGGPTGIGAQLYLTDINDILDIHMLCNELGIDAFSGLQLAWAFEAYQKGLITKEDTDGLELNWGDAKVVATLFKKMAYREGFGDILADGIKACAEKYGGKEFASHVKGIPTTTIPVRSLYGMGVNYAVNDSGADHCRVYPPYPPIAESIPEHVKLPFDLSKAVVRDIPDEKGKLSKWLYDTRAVINSMTMCVFTSRGKLFSDFEIHADALNAATGEDFTVDELYKIGERICNLERSFNVMNVDASRKDDTLPKRMTEEPVNDGGSIGMVCPLEPMLDEYYAARNWSVKTGRPTRQKLLELNLDFVVEDFKKKGVWEEKEFELIYLGHFNDCCGKEKERRKFNVSTVNELIDELDNLYPGVGKLLRRPDGTAMPQNAIILNRKGSRAIFVYDFTIELEDNDSITLI